MRRLCCFLGKVFASLFHWLHLSECRSAFRYIRTGFLSYRLLHLGNNSSFEKMVKIIGPENIWISDCVHVGTCTTLYTKRLAISSANPLLKIGNNVDVGDRCHITAVNRIEIEDNVLLGKDVTITDNAHGSIKEYNVPPLNRDIISKGTVIIKKNVWIGDKCTILPGVTIGEGTIVGANSVVTKSVPEKSVVVGNPARIIF